MIDITPQIRKILADEFNFAVLKQDVVFSMYMGTEIFTLKFKSVPSEEEIIIIEMVVNYFKLKHSIQICFNFGKFNQKWFSKSTEEKNNVFGIAIDALYYGLTDGNVYKFETIDNGFYPIVYFCDEMAKYGISPREQNLLFSKIVNGKGGFDLYFKGNPTHRIPLIKQVLGYCCETYGDYLDTITINTDSKPIKIFTC